MDENKPRRRWLSFGIRDLLWAMVVVGMGIGWWAQHRHATDKAEAESIAQLNRYITLMNKCLELKTAISNSGYEVVGRGFPKLAKKKSEQD
jgi:hypothetical protein